jgi:hypothetical protein
MRTPRTSPALVLALMLLAASSTGCALLPAPQARPVEPPRVPAPPADLMVPPSCGTCSESVLELFRQWQQRLIPTRPA